MNDQPTIQPTTVTEPAPAAPHPAPEAPKAKFVNMGVRLKSVPLVHPIEYDGTVYDAVTVRRITGAEVADWMAAIIGGDKAVYPGIEVPEAVYRALDADDLAKVDQELQSFLPLGLRGESEPTQQA